MKTISQLAPEYVAFRKARNKSLSTIKHDLQGLRVLQLACGDIQPANITLKHMDRLAVIMAEGKSASTFNARLAAIRVFLAWCRKRGYMPRDYDPLGGADIEPLKVALRERDRVPVTQFNALLDTAGHPRDRILGALALHLLLRISEIVSIRIGDVSLETGEIHVYMAKTSEWDVMPISAHLDRELRSWLTFYAEEQGELQDDWLLVPAKEKQWTVRDDRGRLVRNTPQACGRLKPTTKMCRPERQVKAMLAQLGFDTQGEGGHTLRRSAARALFDEYQARGYDNALRRVQSMLHHKQITMTERYIGLTADRHARNKDIRGQVVWECLEVDTNVVPLLQVNLRQQAL